MTNKIKKQFRNLNIIYLVILGTLSIAALTSVIIVYNVGAIAVFDHQSINIVKSVVIIALLVGIPVSHVFFHKKIKHIDRSLGLSTKITFFQTAFIVRIAMLEGIGLLGIIGYFTTADKSFLYMFGVVFILFIIHAPTKQRISSDLELSEEEGELLNNAN